MAHAVYKVIVIVKPPGVQYVTCIKFVSQPLDAAEYYSAGQSISIEWDVRMESSPHIFA
jgi:hypothetical protein